jgi:Protein of unknown function (DUF1553)/Protein of unknown function (DUF1549)/Planctomycete cytochrome C
MFQTARLIALILLSALFVHAEDNRAVFQKKLSPLLQTYCASCHNGANPQNEFSIATYETLLRGGKHGQALTPGSAQRSLLIAYVRGEKSPKMPLGGSLPDAVINELATAIDSMVSVDEAKHVRDEHLEWLLKPPKAPAIPVVKNQNWVRNPIDAFILSKLEAKNLSPAQPADRRALIRRLYFDLIGLPPHPEEVQRFVSNPDPEAYEKLIDQVLADPRYGERWGRHWLDLARYAESDGFAVDTERPTAWRYRDYVIRAFNQDKPYDLFIKEQLAGDELKEKPEVEKDGPERLVALGFLRMATWEIDATSRQQLRQDFLNELTGTTASVFLGLTVGCAQCHNHKYDPIPQRDFYRMQAFFAATGIEELPDPFSEAENPKELKRLRRRYEDAVEVAEAELEKHKKELMHRFIESKNLKQADPAVVEFMRELKVANVFFQERNDPIFKEVVWKNYLEAKDNLQHLSALEKRYQPLAWAVKDEVPPNVPTIPDTYLLVSGQLESKGEKTEPGFLECTAGKAEPAKIPFVEGSSGRRLALAEWIASAENPLTARVMVNRIWQNHFGEGLVRTASDFGKNGARPSHPKLLDWLATQFVEQKWSIKAMHKLMLTSDTYRQSTAHAEWKRYTDIDPNNELLWRMNWVRLDAEVLRDSILELSGRLNPAQGGPSVLLDAPDDVAEGFEFFKWFPSEEAEQRRRTVYTFQRRSIVNPMLEVFDVANMNASCPRRNTTTVTPQALTLMNGDLTNKEAQHFAARIIKEAGPNPDQQIERAFWLVLGRPASEKEKSDSRKLLAKFPPPAGLADLGVVLFNLNEFLYLE